MNAINPLSNGLASLLDVLGVSGGRKLRSSSGVSASTAAEPLRAPGLPVQPVDRVEISDHARQASTEAGELPDSPLDGEASHAHGREVGSHSDGASALGSVKELTPEQEKQVAELRDRDREVRAHEQAHKAAGGQYAGAPSYEFQTGPDGKRYAVGGSVPIDTSPVAGDPEATIRKMDQIRRAANAPAQPSGADRAIASQAARTQAEARAELARERTESLTGGGESGEVATSAPLNAGVREGAEAVVGLDGRSLPALESERADEAAGSAIAPSPGAASLGPPEARATDARDAVTRQALSAYGASRPLERTPDLTSDSTSPSKNRESGLDRLA